MESCLKYDIFEYKHNNNKTTLYSEGQINLNKK